MPRPYKVANLVIPNDLHERKVALGLTWMQVVERGIEACEKEILDESERPRVPGR